MLNRFQRYAPQTSKPTGGALVSPAKGAMSISTGWRHAKLPPSSRKADFVPRGSRNQVLDSEQGAKPELSPLLPSSLGIAYRQRNYCYSSPIRKWTRYELDFWSRRCSFACVSVTSAPLPLELDLCCSTSSR